MIYLYFNSEGALLEYIKYPVRQGGLTYDIYIFVEDNDRMTDELGYYPFPTNEYASYICNFHLPAPITGITDAQGNLLIPPNGALADEGVLVVDEVPWNKRRDLLHFKYFKKYQFLKIEVDSDTHITDEDGYVDASLYLGLIGAPEGQYDFACDTFSFEVEDSVITQEPYIFTSQYHYLLDRINQLSGGVGLVKSVNEVEPDYRGNVTLYGTDIEACEDLLRPIVDPATTLLNEDVMPASYIRFQEDE